MNEARSTLERAANALLTLLSGVYVGLVLWQHVDPSFEPRELVERALEPVRETLRRRRELLDTLEEIRDLPEHEGGQP